MCRGSAVVFVARQLAEPRFPSQTANLAQFANAWQMELLALLSAGIKVCSSRFDVRLGYTERMMSQADSHSSHGVERPMDRQVNADWRQLEAFIDTLHESARASIEVREFYQHLLEGSVTLLAADGGAVWLPTGRGVWRPLVAMEQPRDSASEGPEHARLLSTVAESAVPQVLQPRSRGENPTDAVLALVAVREESSSNCHSVIELRLRPGCSPETQQGWRDLLATVAEVAAGFHLRDHLRKLRTERAEYDQSIALVRRLQQSTDLQQTAYDIANEGRDFVSSDRLSVLTRRGSKWQLLATSGVDRIEARADAAKRLVQLAEISADWGEPFDYTDANSSETTELPPALTEVLRQHVDESHARRVVAVPLELVEAKNEGIAVTAQHNSATAILIAEQFASSNDEFSKQRVLELANLCAPALRQAVVLDRFPVRSTLRWADRWAKLRESWGLSRLALASAMALALLLALVLVQRDFEIEAPATLRPAIERDIFATASGKIVDVRIAHGELVDAGDVLAILDDPQLSLDVQRVEGEIATTRQRLAAIAVARTDRKVREEATHEQLPLAAEVEQLQKKLASLQTQQTILSARREALTLRSPIAGTVLTLDVQNLLLTRPVERGQVLFTVADASQGWRLVAQVPQDRIGHVVAAHQQVKAPVAVRFRLAGGTDQIYQGRVESISSNTVLNAAALDPESPAFEVQIQVDRRDLPRARPGMSAEVRIHSGRRSLGYIWLHDIWELVYSWWVF